MFVEKKPKGPRTHGGMGRRDEGGPIGPLKDSVCLFKLSKNIDQEESTSPEHDAANKTNEKPIEKKGNKNWGSVKKGFNLNF